MLNVNPETLVGRWIRPWPEEGLVGIIIKREGDLLECRAVGGGSFFVRTKDIQAGRLHALEAFPDYGVRLSAAGRERLRQTG